MSMRKISFCLVLLLFAAYPVQAADWTGKVVGVSDGDTITVLDGTTQVKIRLYGIDCPEKGQAFGTRAKQMTGDLAAGKIVTVRPKDKDRYGRTVAEIILPDGTSLNRALVREGMAWHFVRYAKNDQELAKLEAEARTAKRGLWADKEPVAPWEWRAKRAKEKAR
ncbi:thermonuclease family protein [soil metagenome]